MPTLTATALAQRIDALLPQTQCRQCGETGCRPYAEAVATGAAPINRCPPGGDATIAAVAALLGAPVEALDASRGATKPFALAHINERTCIGCTLCLQVCPTDAIVGASKQMHTILAAYCTGCELCLPPCPVNCIAMQPADRSWTPVDAARARERFALHNARLARNATRTDARKAAQGARAARREAVAQALARARARRGPTAKIPS
jgi:Na+-translocating ferredoxin:NAD+ oxidoreductase subunit B